MLREMKRRLERAFTEDQVAILAEVLDEQRTGLATSVDMQDLKDAVKRLAIAQARTEDRMDRVEAAIEKLTTAQARTEKRLDRLEDRMERVEAAIEKLTAAQARTEERLERVEAAIEKLTAAQVRTEKRLDRLEDRLDRVEAAIEKLTAAQIQTEQTLNNLIRAHRETRRQLGGLSMTVGYTLENAAYRALPALLKADYGIEVQGQLIRTYLKGEEPRAEASGLQPHFSVGCAINRQSRSSRNLSYLSFCKGCLPNLVDIQRGVVVSVTRPTTFAGKHTVTQRQVLFDRIASVARL